MRIIKNDLSENLEIPEFSCDKLLSENIPPPLPNQNFAMAITGRPQSGKTSLLIALLTNKKPYKCYKKVFHHVILFMPQSSMKSLKKNIFEKISDEQKFDELTLENLEMAYELVKMWREEGHQTLIIFDDMTSSLKINEIQKRLKQMIFNMRHLKISLIFLSQSIIAIPPEIRRNLSHIITFKPAMKEWEIYCNEFLNMASRDREILYDFVFDKNHNFLFNDMKKGKLYKKFDEIVFESDEENSR